MSYYQREQRVVNRIAKSRRAGNKGPWIVSVKHAPSPTRIARLLNIALQTNGFYVISQRTPDGKRYVNDKYKIAFQEEEQLELEEGKVPLTFNIVEFLRHLGRKNGDN